MNRYGVTVRIPGVTGPNAFIAFLAGGFTRRGFRAMESPRHANPWRGLRLPVGVGEPARVPALSHDLPHQPGRAVWCDIGEPLPFEHPEGPEPGAAAMLKGDRRPSRDEREIVSSLAERRLGHSSRCRWTLESIGERPLATTPPANRDARGPNLRALAGDRCDRSSPHIRDHTGRYEQSDSRLLVRVPVPDHGVADLYDVHVRPSGGHPRGDVLERGPPPLRCPDPLSVEQCGARGQRANPGLLFESLRPRSLGDPRDLGGPHAHPRRREESTGSLGRRQAIPQRQEPDDRPCDSDGDLHSPAILGVHVSRGPGANLHVDRAPDLVLGGPGREPAEPHVQSDVTAQELSAGIASFERPRDPEDPRTSATARSPGARSAYASRYGRRFWRIRASAFRRCSLNVEEDSPAPSASRWMSVPLGSE